MFQRCCKFVERVSSKITYYNQEVEIRVIYVDEMLTWTFPGFIYLYTIFLIDSKYIIG